MSKSNKSNFFDKMHELRNVWLTSSPSEKLAREVLAATKHIKEVICSSWSIKDGVSDDGQSIKVPDLTMLFSLPRSKNDYEHTISCQIRKYPQNGGLQVDIREELEGSYKRYVFNKELCGRWATSGHYSYVGKKTTTIPDYDDLPSMKTSICKELEDAIKEIGLMESVDKILH